MARHSFLFIQRAGNADLETTPGAKIAICDGWVTLVCRNGFNGSTGGAHCMCCAGWTRLVCRNGSSGTTLSSTKANTCTWIDIANNANNIKLMHSELSKLKQTKKKRGYDFSTIFHFSQKSQKNIKTQLFSIFVFPREANLTLALGMGMGGTIKDPKIPKQK